MSSSPLVDALRADLTTAFAELLEDTDALADAAEVERLACMGVLPLDDPDLPDGPISEAVTVLEQQGGRAAPLLATAELLGSPRLRAAASAALARLRAQEGEPRVPAGLGALRLRDALRMRSDEADVYLLSLARPGDPRVQNALVIVEREETGGTLVEGLVGEPTDRSAGTASLEQFAATAPLPLVREQPSVAEVRAALIAAAERTRELDLEVSFALAAWLPLLSLALTGDPQALGHLPPAPPEEPDDGLYADPDDPDEFELLAEEIMADFEAEVLEAQSADSPLGRNGRFIAQSMLDFKWGYGDGRLARWTVDDVEEFLLEHAPRKLSQPGEESEDNADCVIALLEFLDDAGVLVGDTVGTLVRVTKSLRSEAARAAQDPSRWGMAKSLFMQAAAEGLDVEDPEAIEGWMESFNSRPREERDRILGPPLEGLAGQSEPAGSRQKRGDQQARRRKRKAERAARKRNRR